MNWPQLICATRFGLEDYNDGRAGSRSEFRRDYDRLVFSSPFRRLQNKTQVFPLPGSIFVHNRLTHSLEVACVGKSMADTVSRELRAKYAGCEWSNRLYHIGDIVAAACLAHDLGNPPFGHSGEKSISTFFSEGDGAVLQDELDAAAWCDFVHFEGNANSLRLLMHQFAGRRQGGFAMTYSTLAAVVKYPYESALAGSDGKFGIFQSERDDFKQVADTLGMKQLSADGEPLRYARHPLVYLVEAADDICYEVMDIEDAHKLRILTTSEVIDSLLQYFNDTRRAEILANMERVADPNEKIAYLRSCVVGALVERCAEVFIKHEEDILAGTFTGPLLHHIPTPERNGFDACTRLSWTKIYGASDVVDVELAGNRIITFLLQKHIHAVRFPDLNYSRLLLSKVPSQYDIHAPALADRVRAVLDHISGMTDVYALDLYRKLNGMSLPAV